MAKNALVRVSDVRGAGRLAIDATLGVTDLVEAMHHTVARRSFGGQPSTDGRTRGITGFVYRSVRGVAKLVGMGLDAALGGLTPLFAGQSTSPAREALLGALNGVLGDHLVASGNPLAIAMQLRRGGVPLAPDAKALAAAIPDPQRKIVLLLHGLCMNDLQWSRNGHDHGAALARDLGYTPLYLHYNSGLPIARNGRELSALLEQLVARWPVAVDEVSIVAHSMGGLVARSAIHYGSLARSDWPRRLAHLVFLGTPHHGAPLERGGHWIDLLLERSAFSAPFARLGRVRSAGIIDLRHGNVLDLADDEARSSNTTRRGARIPVPLPDDVACYAIAASTGKRRGDFGDRLLGDGLVPVDSAFGSHETSVFDLGIPQERRWLGLNMGHMDLLSHEQVYAQIKRWLS